MAKSKLEIGLFATRKISQVLQLQAEIEKLRPGICKLFLQPENGSPSVTLSKSTLLWDGVDVSRLRCAYIHGFRYCNPIVPSTMENVDWTLWQTDYIAVQQSSSFVFSTYSEMDRRGVRLFNSLSAHVLSFTKLNLLETLRQHGLNIPRLVCTNDRKLADDFTGDKEKVYLWRPATGRAAWQLCGERQKIILLSPTSPPILIMEAKRGPLLRSFVFGGQVVLTLSYGVPCQTPLERLEVFLPAEYQELHDALVRVSELTNLRWGVIHWTFNEEKAWIYDVDMDPELSVFPESIRIALTRAIASGLVSKDYKFDKAGTELPNEIQMRDQPFLRRMLSILFEAEARKYIPVEKS